MRRAQNTQLASKAQNTSVSQIDSATTTKKLVSRPAAKATSVSRKPKRSNVMMRRIVSRPKATRRRRNALRGKLLPVMAALVFIAGLGVSTQGWLTNKDLKTQVMQASTGGENQTNAPPSSEKPSEATVNSYAVAPDMPRYFKMTQFGGVKARILPMGVTNQGQLKSPNNIHDVGWYNASSRPGQGGAVLLDAHVSSWDAAGVFARIKDLRIGDTVSIERGDGQEFTYRIMKQQEYDAKAVDMKAALLPITPGRGGLTMITCSGNVVPGTSEFDKRLLVFAEQM